MNKTNFKRIGLYGLISSTILSHLVTNNKGLKLQQFLKQMFAFFIDGTNMSISGFDQIKRDEGFAAMLENKTDEMASSHQIKRFFAKQSIVTNLIFNHILKAYRYEILHVCVRCDPKLLPPKHIFSNSRLNFSEKNISNLERTKSKM